METQLDEQGMKLQELHKAGDDLLKDVDNKDEASKDIKKQLDEFDECWNDIAKQVIERIQTVSATTLTLLSLPSLLFNHNFFRTYISFLYTLSYHSLRISFYFFSPPPPTTTTLSCIPS